MHRFKRCFSASLVALICIILLLPIASSSEDQFPYPTQCRITTIKFDINGNHVWESSYNTSQEDRASAIDVDEYGNVFVTGKAHDEDGSFFTIMHDTDGNPLWKSHLGEDDTRGMNLAVHPSGGIVVTGGGEEAITTVRFDQSGKMLWSDYQDGFPAELDSNAIAVDPSGQTYVLGRSLDGGLLVLLYDNMGQLIWQDEIEGGHPHYNTGHLALGTSGRLAVSGNLDNNYDIAAALVLYESDGIKLWEKQIPMGQDFCVKKLFVHFPGVQGLALDDQDNVFLTGTEGCTNTREDYDLVTNSYDISGTECWAVRQEDLGDENSEALSLTPEGDIVISGNSADGTLMLAKYDSSGSEQWNNQSFHEIGGGFHILRGLHVDASGNTTTVMGTCTNGEGYGFPLICHDLVLIKLNREGNEILRKIFPVASGWSFEPADTAIDLGGNFFITGTLCKMELLYDDNDDETGCGCDAGNSDTGAAQVLLTIIMLVIGFGARRLARR